MEDELEELGDVEAPFGRLLAVAIVLIHFTALVAYERYIIKAKGQWTWRQG